MDAELKQRWIGALQSGQYKKGKHFLREQKDGEEYWCCLGILCNLVDADGWYDPVIAEQHVLNSKEVTEDGKIERHLDIIERTVIPYEEDTSLLPIHILEQIDKGNVNPTSHQDALIARNDKNSNFDEVIEYIEKEL